MTGKNNILGHAIRIGVAFALIQACGQTYKPGTGAQDPDGDFEIVPQDGGSTVGTPKIKTDEYFVQKYGKKLDILFVLDNSGSMVQELANVRANFEEFIKAFVAKNMDFQIGLISTDARSDAKAWDGVTPQKSGAPNAFKNYPNAGPGKLLARAELLAKTGGKPYLSSASLSKDDIVALFKKNTELGVDGSGAETGMLSVLKFLAPDLQSGFNAGFMRPDATFVTVVVSDEDESLDPDFEFDSDKFQPFLRDVALFDGKFGWTGKDPDLYSPGGRLSTFVTRVNAAKANRPDRYQYYAMISPTATSCATTEFERTTNIAFKDTPYFYKVGDAAFPGAKGDGVLYETLANMLYGTKGPSHSKSVCSNFATALGDFGSKIANHVERNFDVSNRVESCMKVYINDERIPEKALDGWTFDPTKNRVTIDGLGLEEKESFTVKIKYVSLTDYPEFKVTRAPASARTSWGCK